MKTCPEFLGILDRLILRYALMLQNDVSDALYQIPEPLRPNVLIGLD
ncbi:MAG: hypothetical protein OQL19_17765 [Gammaproteobacteria bacterium]|nr:hypothetical protein [Gammaproteobacteria bacterium]